MKLPETLPTRTTSPRVSRSAGRNARITLKAPVRLVARTRSQSSSEVSSKRRFLMFTPAATTSACSDPIVSRELRDRVAVGDVERVRGDAGARALLDQLGPPRGGVHPRAGVGERQRGREPDPGRRAGDQRDLAVERAHASRPSPARKTLTSAGGGPPASAANAPGPSSSGRTCRELAERGLAAHEPLERLLEVVHRVRVGALERELAAHDVVEAERRVVGGEADVDRLAGRPQQPAARGSASPARRPRRARGPCPARRWRRARPRAPPPPSRRSRARPARPRARAAAAAARAARRARSPPAARPAA